MRAGELSARYIDAYNGRDVEAVRDLLAPSVKFVRPGGVTLGTVDDVVSMYEQEWKSYDGRIEVRRAIEAGDSTAIEFTLTVPTPDGPQSFDGAVFHRWENHRLSEYRFYTDFPPPSR